MTWHLANGGLEAWHKAQHHEHLAHSLEHELLALGDSLALRRLDERFLALPIGMALPIPPHCLTTNMRERERGREQERGSLTRVRKAAFLQFAHSPFDIFKSEGVDYFATATDITDTELFIE